MAPPTHKRPSPKGVPPVGPARGIGLGPIWPQLALRDGFFEDCLNLRAAARHQGTS